ncbi:MAG TPA: DNA repair helicase XPB [Chloroflexota bacterium]|nr:DNA repair helicase XPB [Chloroflexota bacterium]
MAGETSRPIIVQGDRTVLLEVNNPSYAEARDALARFAELEKSPEHVHTYRITPLSLWNAAAAGLNTDEILDALTRFSKYDLPSNVATDVVDYISRFGRLKLVRDGDDLLLISDDVPLLAEIAHHKRFVDLIKGQRDEHALLVSAALRGQIKQALVQFGYPAEDLAGYVDGAPLAVVLRPVTTEGEPFSLRPYQQEAVDIFYAAGGVRGGSGVVVLPCGAGKTVVGLAIMSRLQTNTLILTPNTVAARQWIEEIDRKTRIPSDMVGEYSGERKEIRPVTVANYQILTHRSTRNGDFPHFELFNQRDWGLIIYDEVHLLPAPVFRITAEIQARRRLGLTATLVREDGREEDVFSLIGPKKYDVPWKQLEQQGWIATAECHEIRMPLPNDLRMTYAMSEDREKYRVAAENPSKLDAIKTILGKHPDDQVLIIGQYIDQITQIAHVLDAPLITGKTPTREREKLYEQFRTAEIRLLVVSKVANFAIDLPDANVAIQISGTYGSRQEEAQRLGRILRPKRHGLLAHFYTLVTRDTKDQDFAAKRQMFLTEQGYRYQILGLNELGDYQPVTFQMTARRLEHPALSAPSNGWQRN